MAASGNRQLYRRQVNSAGRGYTNTYIDGNVVRRVHSAPRRSEIRREREEREALENARRNREKARNVNRPYVAFLTVACVATVAVCVNFLQLQAEGITYRNRIARLESTLTSMKLANDSTLEEVKSSVDMKEARKIAIEELGMSYATEGQIITYGSQDGDFIRQYAEIPME